MIKNWAIYILVFIAAFIFFLFYKMWIAWYLIIFLLFCPVFSLILCIFSSFFFKYEIKVPSNVKLGEENVITIKTKSKWVLFSRYKINLKITDIMTGTSRLMTFTGHSSYKDSFPVDTSHCGTYSYEITGIRLYDLLGLFHFTKRTKKVVEAIVKPVPTIPPTMPKLNGYKAKHLKKSNSTYSEIYDVRDYVIGDPIKSVHWKASAKRDTILVKEPQEECCGHARVLIKLCADRDELDQKLGELYFTSNYFINHDIMHKIRIIPPKKREVSYDIQSQRDLDKAMISILRTRIPKEVFNER